MRISFSTALVQATSVLVLLMGAATGAPSQESGAQDAPAKSAAAQQEDEDARAQAAEIAAKLAERRGLKLDGPAKVEMLSPDAFRAALRSQHIELKSKAYFEGTQRALRLLGILPADFTEDLLEVSLDASQSSLFGIYSPTRRAILIPKTNDQSAQPMANSAIFRREILAHELHHAAQDCRWPIASLIGQSAPNHDARLARSALLEGDAVCTAMDLILSETGSSIFEYEGDIATTIKDQLELGSVLETAKSGVLADPTARLFEYGDGTGLVHQILTAKGWEGVNAALDDPPASSEQVLHPTKYLDQRDWPVTTALVLPPELAEQGWELAASDRLGEMTLRELMGLALTDAELVRASFGWDGDRWILMRRGEEEALLWTSVWDSRTDARQAFNALAAVYEMEGATKDHWRYATDRAAGSVLLRRKADRVAMCIGLDLDPDELGAGEGAPWRSVDGALTSPLRHHEADERKGRGEARVTRRLEKEAIDALEAASIEVDGLTVRLRDLGLELTLPGPQWIVKTDTPMASVRVMLLRGDLTVNLNVNVAPSGGLDLQQTIDASLAYLKEAFGNVELEHQGLPDDPRGPAFELRYAMDIGTGRCWFHQLGFLRDTHFIVLTCTSVGTPIEGDVAKEFQALLDGATFAQPKK